MKIHSITKYTFKGKEYKSLNEIKEEIHNTIGLEILDPINRTCPLEKHKDYEKLLNLLCSPKIRQVLLECLDVTFTDEDDDEIRSTINVLDIK